MKLSIIPDIIFRGTTINYGDYDGAGNRGRRETRTFRLIPETPIIIDYNYDVRKSPQENRRNYTRTIKKQLLEIVKDAIQVGIDNDISLLTGDPNSPPIVIKKPTGYDQSEQIQDLFAQKNTSATFNIIKKDGKTINNQFGKERVWLLNAPQLNKEIDFYEHTSDSLSCGYDYIVNNFGNKKGFIKFSKSKEVIDKVINNPTKENELIFNEWEKEYWDEFNIDKDDFHTLPEYIDTNEIEEKEWYNINCVDLSKSTWKNKDIDNSLCILDIVKWCIVGKVRLNVIDHDNNYYLTYNPQQYKDKYSKPIRTKLNISMIVKYNHAYFITDENLKKSLSMRDTNFKLDLDGLKGLPNIEKDKKEEEEPEIEKIELAERDYIINKNTKPPPTAEELIKLMDKEQPTNYYVDMSKLNGLVDYLFRHHKLIPKKIINQNRTTIDKVQYNNLTILSNKKRPPNLEYLDTSREDFYNQYGKLIELYPLLNKAYIPSDTEIAHTLYEDTATEDIYSMFNSNTRKLFFNSEIKPDNRRFVKPDFMDNPTISFDFKRAYTTALKYNEFNYSVFDAINHPVKYRGDFKPDRFYICKNLDRKLRGGYGKRMLYHGVYLQYIMDKVEIQSVINPVKEIPKDYFNKFLTTIDKLEQDGILENITTPKALINNFIGALKKKDGITDYTSWLINNKETALRELMKGNVPIKLRDDGSWRNECLITSKAKHTIHFQSAQPIRLQIMETINAQNFLLIKHYKNCLYSMRFIHNYQNDIKQRKTLSKIRNKKSAIPKNKKLKDINYTPIVQSIKTDAVYFKSPFNCECVKRMEYEGFEKIEKKTWKNSEGMMKFINYVVYSFNKKGVWKIVNENIMESYEYAECLKDYREQIPIVLGKNKWKTDIDIIHKWDKDIGGKILLNHAIYNDGAWISGLGGRGKSELIIGLDKIIQKNSKNYRWVRIFYKLTQKNKYLELCEEWRNRNPVYYEKFAPTNIACNRIEGKTLHKGLGIPVIKGQEEEDKEPEDNIEYISYVNSILKRLEGNGKNPCYDILVVDELSMVGGYIMSILSYIKTRIPRIKFILMGDLDHQLKPVGEEHRNFVNSLAIKELVNHNKLTLHYNFRTGKTIDELYEKCRDNPQELIHYGEPTKRNLSFTHNKRKQIIEYHQDQLINPIVIETNNTKTGHNDNLKIVIGTPLIATKSLKEQEIYKNEIYYVKSIDEENIELENERNEIEIDNHKDLIKWFCSAYCITIHKSQSQTFRDDYTIHEWSFISQSNDNFLRLRYTAMSRSDDYENKVFMRL